MPSRADAQHFGRRCCRVRTRCPARGRSCGGPAQQHRSEARGAVRFRAATIRDADRRRGGGGRRQRRAPARRRWLRQPDGAGFRRPSRRDSRPDALDLPAHPPSTSRPTAVDTSPKPARKTLSVAGRASVARRRARQRYHARGFPQRVSDLRTCCSSRSRLRRRPGLVLRLRNAAGAAAGTPKVRCQARITALSILSCVGPWTG
jgi:hypothetical protein